MDDATRSRLIDAFDARPASVDEYRSIKRLLFTHLALDGLETEIVLWDANGRDPAQLDRLSKAAWDFSEALGSEPRKRLFAAFVTNNSETDGYGADYLIEFAEAAGISCSDVVNAMTMGRNASS